MADLDDFFAKKDKKKKTKKGFSKANTDVLAKNLQESDRAAQKAEDKATGPLATSEATKLAFEDNPVLGVNGDSTSDANPGTTNPRNDDEWLDYENETKDYTGLKIETLKIKEADKNDESDHEINEEGEKVVRVKKEGGPWNRRAGQNTEEAEKSASEDGEASNPSPVPPEGSPKPPAKSAYVPPQLRASTAASGPALNPVRLGGGGHGGRRSRAAPDINSEVYFPSLSATSGPGSDDRSKEGGHDFEQVRSGGGQQTSGRGGSERPRLTLGNKFDALRD